MFAQMKVIDIIRGLGQIVRVYLNKLYKKRLKIIVTGLPLEENRQNYFSKE